MKRILSGALLVLLAAMPSAAAQESAAVVSGRVTNPSGAPEAGVLIRIEALNVGTPTGADGRYRLVIPNARLGSAPRNVNITASRVGLSTQSVSIAVAPGARLTQNFQLVPSSVSLEGIVVQGVGAERRQRQLGVATQDAGTYELSGRAAAGAVQSVSPREPPNTESYAAIDEPGFRSPRTAPLSTFSIDVDRASYSNVRRFLREGQRPPKDAVRIEELVNYFAYRYAEPRPGQPFSVATDVAPAPWNSRHQLVRIGLQGRHVDTRDLPPSNLVFLVDVSGSMSPANRLPLVKEALGMLVANLRPQDRISIVVYAGAAGLVLEPTPGDQKGRILEALERLRAGGSTAGGAGLRLAYDVARRSYVAGGNNRVILATDGDFNVGASSDGEMFRLIEERRQEGTSLTVLGFGMGNLKDSKMEGMADRGNGSYAYIDSRDEARKALVSEFGGTLFTIAKDVKLQVEFNPAAVAAYRLIGYENRALRNEEFTDDRRDAGDMGAGHSVTALYEIVPVGVPLDVRVGDTSPLRYQQPAAAAPRTRARHGELAFVRLRYKAPNGDTSREVSYPVRRPRPGAELQGDFAFAVAVAQFGMLLRDSEHRGGASLEGVLSLARPNTRNDPYRREFVALVERFDRIARNEPLQPMGELAER
ncbi:MAG TPA: von Willebrand factor type A domain-containing protein [Longimicrobium sp.]|nr:von Willebrand factor type A domain-containing protein [Longimicrobium sp.]